MPDEAPAGVPKEHCARGGVARAFAQCPPRLRKSKDMKELWPKTVVQRGVAYFSQWSRVHNLSVRRLGASVYLDWRDCLRLVSLLYRHLLPALHVPHHIVLLLQ